MTFLEMKNVLLFISLISIFSGCKPAVQLSEADIADKYIGYDLVWVEDFDTEGKPNPEIWSYEKGFTRNEEMQWYQEDNASVKDGLLIIQGRRERVKNGNYEPDNDNWRKNRKFAEYTSSSIHTRDKKEFKYGILEVRAKIDTADGMWPAIWTLGVTRTWPSNGEIDVMEFYRIKGEPHVLANAAWKGEREYVSWDSERIPFQEFIQKDPDWPDKFHVWKMDWTKDYIKLYLDNELINIIELNKTLNPDGFNPFHQPHYLLLNLAIGANGGDPSKTEFPKNYEVDYVRLYQKNTPHQ